MRRQVATLAIVGLLAAGCGGDDDLFGGIPDLGDEPADDPADEPDEPDDAPDEPAATQPDEPDAPDAPDAPDPGDAGAGEADAIDPADFPTIDERTIDVAVQYGVIEWEIQEMLVVDLDADLQPGEQPQGVEITFPARVFNAGGGTASVNNTPIALQWDDAAGDTFTVSVQPDFRDVPADSFTSGELRVHLTHDDRTLFDDDTAYLLVGQPGVTPAVVPIGSAVDPVTRLLARQDTDGWILDIEGEDTGRQSMIDTITVTDAHVRWSDPDGRPLEDGFSLLQITYTIENRGEAQTCSARGQGGWRLTLPDGDAVNDTGVTERCAASGDTVTDVFTRFVIPTEDFAGDYQLWHERRSGATEPSDEIEVTLVDDERYRLSERD